MVAYLHLFEDVFFLQEEVSEHHLSSAITDEV
jgi:hypothetical protein